MIQIPLSPVASQTIALTLAGQSCQISAYQKQPIVDEYGVAAGLFLDLVVNNVQILRTMRCLDRTRLLLDRTYYGVIGDFIWIDNQGSGVPDFQGTPPNFQNIGTRYFLLYLEAADLANL